MLAATFSGSYVCIGYVSSQEQGQVDRVVLLEVWDLELQAHRKKKPCFLQSHCTPPLQRSLWPALAT